MRTALLALIVLLCGCMQDYGEGFEKHHDPKKAFEEGNTFLSNLFTDDSPGLSDDESATGLPLLLGEGQFEIIKYGVIENSGIPKKIFMDGYRILNERSILLYYRAVHSKGELHYSLALTSSQAGYDVVDFLPWKTPDSRYPERKDFEGPNLLEKMLEKEGPGAQYILRVPKQVKENLKPPAECNEASPGREMEKCIENLAKSRKDPKTCLFITADYGRFTCLKGLASLTGDKYICDSIGSADLRGLCKTETIEKMVEGCNIHNFTVKRNKCLNDLAVNEKTTYFCDEIDVQQARQECISRVVQLTVDPKDCEKLSEASSRDDCIFTIALKREQSPICLKMLGTNNQIACSAILENYPKGCGEIKGDPQLSNLCHYQIAVRENNNKLCGKIRDRKLRRMCVELAA